MQKNLLIVSSFFLTFVLTCIFATYFLNYQQKTAVKGEAGISLITEPWHIEGNKTFSVKNLNVNTNTFSNKDTLLITYNLHGLCMLGDTASEIILVDNQGTLHGVSLSKYGKNCFEGEQTINIPLSKFSTNINNLQITKLEISFWYPTEYAVDITKMIAYSSDAADGSTQTLLSPLAADSAISPTITPTILASTSATVTDPPDNNTHPTWQIQSISSMKVTKDIVCHPQSKTFIEKWVDTAKELGVNYIALETPYDSPSCGDSVAYTKLWISVIRSRGLHVWHRHSFLSFEGIYSTTKDAKKDYLQQISDYIKANPDEFAPDDIFTPIPEPQNGGISGVTYCPQNICIYTSAKEFNQWIRDAMDDTQAAFTSINLGKKIKIGYFGFDGFVTWGNNNPQWSGILEPTTVEKMGNITIDHYPEAVGGTMAEDLKKLRKKYPKTPIVIGEWGTIGGGDTVTQVKNTMGAVAADKNILGFNYWQMSSGGNETLINDDFSHKPNFATVQSFFKEIGK